MVALLSMMGVSTGAAATSSYTGPGDIVSGAAFWGALRGYNSTVAATGTQKAVRVRRASDNTETDVVILTSGDLDTASALTFAGTDVTGNATSSGTSVALTGLASTAHAGSTITGTGFVGTYILSVGALVAGAQTVTTNTSQSIGVAEPVTLTYGLYATKLYDQSGNALDIPQATQSKQPQLFCQGGGPSANLPYLRFATASNQVLSGSSIGNVAVPITLTTVMDRDNALNNSGSFLNINDINPCFEFTGAANQVQLYDGSAVTATVADSVWHAMQGVSNGASGVINVNGTETTGNTGSAGTGGGGVISVGGRAGSNNVYMTAIGSEWGIWLSGFTSGNRTSMNSNMRTYWGV